MVGIENQNRNNCIDLLAIVAHFLPLFHPGGSLLCAPLSKGVLKSNRQLEPIDK